MSARLSTWKTSAITGRIFTKFGIWVFFENLSKKFKFYSHLIRITGTLHEDQYTFFIISCSHILRMRNVSDERCRENQNSFLMISLAICEITVKNIVEPKGHRWQYGECAFRAGYLRLRHTLGICNNYCFSTAIMVVRTRLNVTLYVHVHTWPVLVSHTKDNVT